MKAAEKGKGSMCGEKWLAVKIIIGMMTVVALLVFLAISTQLGVGGALTNEIARKQKAVAPDDLKTLQQSESKTLNQYRWIDKEDGRVQIPVERAMALIAKENRALNNE